MELEGTLLLERSPARRWISIIAVVIPVVAVVMVAAWFVRAYVVPPTIAISGPGLIAAAPPPAPVRAQAPVPQPKQMVAKVEPPAPSPPPAAAMAAPVPAPASAQPAQQMFATLAIAPPNFNNLTSNPPAAFAEPPQAPPAMAAAAPIAAPEPSVAALDASEPIKGPVPLPRHKPHISIASIAGPVPLPRPRPAIEDTSVPDLPAYDRHAIE
jgi:type IV secretory pathway VirB10-like protein